MTFRFSQQSMFSAHWWLLLTLSLLMAALTTRLGFWQLGRAEQKEQLHAQLLAQAQLEPLRTADFLKAQLPPDDWERPVELDGEWLARWTVYLENRSMKGQPGYWVFTPLRLSHTRVVLVQRGWVARPVVAGSTLPRIETPQGGVQLTGRWVAPPSQMMELASANTQALSAQGFATLRQNINMQALSQETGLDFVANVLQTGEASEGLLRDWPTQLPGADKNRAYALQWFALALLCVGLFAWFQIIQKLRHDAS